LILEEFRQLVQAAGDLGSVRSEDLLVDGDDALTQRAGSSGITERLERHGEIAQGSGDKEIGRTKDLLAESQRLLKQ
jgi:hypothetical protein